ncbi:flagellar motor protein MotB [Desulforhabdus sp. TSK]|uniref:flagellar motor protein MotB n=1 Tax=Desulforhabdus sp. TSK TaxID=2925014 RepID=UPI001FC8805C|nr:flagellar motor protein MotB [Desulforhabdus sp. TSK]GKT06726.1 chemotaxis protein MotB [Desulforhabdus sp. TSK]
MEGNVIIIKKGKKRGHGAGHGGGWKVAYADFMTAMMAFFLLMWLISMVAPEKRAQVAYYFKHFSMFEKGGTTLIELKHPSSGVSVVDSSSAAEAVDPSEETPVAEPSPEKVLVERLKMEIETRLADVKDQIIVDTFEGGVRIDMVDKEGNPMFPVGSTEMTPHGKKILREIAGTLRSSGERIAVEGHTDARVYTTDHYGNWELSTERASAARKELERNGVTTEKIVRVAGYAASDPLVKENPLDARNRRISLLLFRTYGATGGMGSSIPGRDKIRKEGESNPPSNASDLLHQYLLHR